jgi:hypothetical protein
MTMLYVDGQQVTDNNLGSVTLSPKEVRVLNILNATEVGVLASKLADALADGIPKAEPQPAQQPEPSIAPTKKGRIRNDPATRWGSMCKELSKGEMTASQLKVKLRMSYKTIQNELASHSTKINKRVDGVATYYTLK